MATFGAETFDEIGDNDGSGLSFASSVQGRRVVIPGRDGSLFWRNSSSAHTLETEALCSYAEIEGLRSKVGQGDMLTLKKTAGFALLMGVSPVRVFDSSCYVARLSFRYGGSFTVPGMCGYGNCYGIYD